MSNDQNLQGGVQWDLPAAPPASDMSGGGFPGAGGGVPMPPEATQEPPKSKKGCGCAIIAMLLIPLGLGLMAFAGWMIVKDKALAAIEEAREAIEGELQNLPANIQVNVPGQPGGTPAGGKVPVGGDTPPAGGGDTPPVGGKVPVGGEAGPGPKQ